MTPRTTREAFTADASGVAGIPSADAVQALRDLIIITCQHSPKLHAHGAAALDIVNALEQHARSAGGAA